MHYSVSFLLLALITSWIPLSVAIPFDPCAAPGPIARGDPFTVGLVLVPGVDAARQAQLTTLLGSICSPDTQTLLAQWNAKVAVYQTRADRLTVLKLPFADIIMSMYTANPPTLAVAAFRGGVASPPAFMASGDGGITLGAGFVVSLALLLRFSKGNLQYLQWYNQKCNECSDNLCVRSGGAAAVQGCATPLDTCTCAGNTRVDLTGGRNCTYDDPAFTECATAVNVAWSGDDRNQAVFRTGAQVQRLNAYSIMGIFRVARDTFLDARKFVYKSIAKSWFAVKDDAQKQSVDLQSTLTDYTKPPPPAPQPSAVDMPPAPPLGPHPPPLPEVPLTPPQAPTTPPVIDVPSDAAPGSPAPAQAEVPEAGQGDSPDPDPDPGKETGEEGSVPATEASPGADLDPGEETGEEGSVPAAEASPGADPDPDPGEEGREAEVAVPSEDSPDSPADAI